MIAPGLPRFDLGLADLAHDHDLVLCDIWGVIHNGIEHHVLAVDALRRFRQGGGTVVLITNAPSPRAKVQRWLDRLEVPRDAYDAIATSGDVTIDMIVAAGCPPLFNIGPKHETALYEAAGEIGPRAPALVPIEAAQLAICIGLDETGDAPSDYDAALRRLHAKGLDLVCANPDILVEVGDTLVYCAGAIAERYTALGGVVIQAGKPFPAIYTMALALAEAIRGPVQKSRVVAIGDAMHTDIRGARNQGVTSILITSGIHRAKLHDGDRDSALNERALARFLADHTGGSDQKEGPTAALSMLRWSV